MPTKTDHLSALARICRRFGGRLAVISQRAYDALFEQRVDHMYGGEELSEAPFTNAHGLWWKKKIIYAVRGRENVNNIIHEMGHVFASLTTRTARAASATSGTGSAGRSCWHVRSTPCRRGRITTRITPLAKAVAVSGASSRPIVDVPSSPTASRTHEKLASSEPTAS